MDRKTMAVVTVLCIVVLFGGAVSAAHVPSGYSAEVSANEDSISYSFGKGTGAEYRLTVSEDSSPVDKVYLLCDEGYGNIFGEIADFTERLHKRLADRGCDSTVIGVSGLSEVLSGTAAGTGIVMGSGTIPEEVSDTLLKWVQEGGTLYWTFGTLGILGSRSDGTTFIYQKSLENLFLGSECTSLTGNRADALDTSDPFSEALGLKNNDLSFGLEKDRIGFEHRCFGYTDGSVSEVSLVRCGSGTVAVVSGDHDVYQTTDLAQLICSGITAGSAFTGSATEKVSPGEKAHGSLDVSLVPGRTYTVFVYAEGINPPYGKVWRFEA